MYFLARQGLPLRGDGPEEQDSNFHQRPNYLVMVDEATNTELVIHILHVNEDLTVAEEFSGLYT